MPSEERYICPTLRTKYVLSRHHPQLLVGCQLINLCYMQVDQCYRNTKYLYLTCAETAHCSKASIQYKNQCVCNKLQSWELYFLRQSAAVADTIFLATLVLAAAVVQPQKMLKPANAAIASADMLLCLLPRQTAHCGDFSFLDLQLHACS